MGLNIIFAGLPLAAPVTEPEACLRLRPRPCHHGHPTDLSAPPPRRRRPHSCRGWGWKCERVIEWSIEWSIDWPIDYFKCLHMHIIRCPRHGPPMHGCWLNGDTKWLIQWTIDVISMTKGLKSNLRRLLAWLRSTRVIAQNSWSYLIAVSLKVPRVSHLFGIWVLIRDLVFM